MPGAPLAAPPVPKPALEVKGIGLATPESVLYDAAEDVYLVSNINGAPGATDNNGFISKIAPDGAVVAIKWIEAGRGGAKLDAPKGMAILGDTLYVADISRVRRFDKSTGKPKGDIDLPGATFVNDLAAGDGRVYASDSGIKISDKVEATGSDAVWVIQDGKAKKLAQGAELGRPNGLAVVGKNLWVVTFGTNELYRLDEKGARQDVKTLPKGSLDGIVDTPSGMLISSWEASGVWKGMPSGTFELMLKDLAAPADIGFDSKRGRVLVPRFNDNEIEAFDVK